MHLFLKPVHTSTNCFALPEDGNCLLASALGVCSLFHTMFKKKLCIPLLRRTLTSIPQQHFTSTFSTQIKLCVNHVSPFAPKDLPCHNNPTSCYYYSLGCLGFYGKSLCSESAEKMKSGCWNCHAVNQSATPFLVCDSCRCIQPVDDSIDYFQIFGSERKYDIEGENLEGKYKEWQKKLHPDLVHSKSQKERDFAAEQSARVIDAYRTLSKPLSRGIYMLKLYGVEIDEEQTISDPELLAEIMEIREAVEEATNSEALNHILTQDLVAVVPVLFFCFKASRVKCFRSYSFEGKR
ncbi:iron-sulfur cluster co-chaperone protein HscB, mitochondrial [Abrus precatorius]|uniref:Iron-sulfur cluster co-chaperone protein HscB, mitochondrial n=1 Tax=Abrus precatorius TaxID=3816 RepID=A0A8B8M915_ABRPR|nr:iron-sulfur cluster co-chaperone protein HscB, mitochondrial [Abrus precatorius]